MKANELMIGDWVKFKNSDLAHRVIAIAGKSIKVDKTHWYSANIFDPIPLTLEILEKNGFKKFDFLHIEGQYYQWTWWENTLISVTLWCRELNNNTKDGLMLKIETLNFSLCLKVNCVHELQHALRLCGIEKEIII
jgi:hypothetical protein